VGFRRLLSVFEMASTEFGRFHRLHGGAKKIPLSNQIRNLTRVSFDEEPLEFIHVAIQLYQPRSSCERPRLAGTGCVLVCVPCETLHASVCMCAGGFEAHGTLTDTLLGKDLIRLVVPSSARTRHCSCHIRKVEHAVRHKKLIRVRAVTNSFVPGCIRLCGRRIRVNV
jgi:hypothetical protein